MPPDYMGDAVTITMDAVAAATAPEITEEMYEQLDYLEKHPEENYYEMKKTSLNTTKVTDRKIKRLYLVAATVVAAAFVMAMPAFADDPLATINNLSDFVFSAIKAIGAILLGFGIVQIGLALKGHDASQRAQGFMTFFGGVVIYFAKDILDMIL